MAALPEELIEDILSRLPVKSLLRFKTASKKWYSLISKNHEFAKSHLKQSSSSSSASKNLIFYQTPADNCESSAIFRSSENFGKLQLKQSSSSASKNLIFCQTPADSYKSSAIFRSSDVDSNASRKINFPVEIATPCRVIGSANGLICVASLYKGDYWFIWNPCTGECKRISVPIRAPAYRLFGFGYDSISDDYKIVGDWDSQFRIFSLKTNSWKILEYSVSSSSAVSAFYSNGALHWCIGPQITAFDLAKEEFYFLDLPEESKFVGTSSKSAWVPLFIDYQGSLCASGRKSIWVMKEYGNSKSWAKLSASLPLPYPYAKPVSISRHGEVVFLTEAGFGFVKSDIQGRMSDDDMSQINHFGDAFVYKESLISPECFNPNRPEGFNPNRR